MCLFTTAFQALPVAYLINNKAMVMHGGLPMKDGVFLDDIRKLTRSCEPGEQGKLAFVYFTICAHNVGNQIIYQMYFVTGTLTDLLWADPQDESGRGPSKRGTSMQFGPDVTAAFCRQNNLDYIIRSHEVKERGWECGHNGKCWTIFSGITFFMVYIFISLFFFLA